ncbi:hypothetical protein HMPREF1531_02031 [Propionibacterium sp. oral taxon 192 str. F0372]|nr:hypothetical protein HMPREF1531_02031 [Propionibacterium sp. oral taxon 192 str. F0372]
MKPHERRRLEKMRQRNDPEGRETRLWLEELIAGDDPRMAASARAAQTGDKAVWQVVDEFLEADRPLSGAEALHDAVEAAGHEQVLDTLRTQAGLSEEWRADMVAEMRSELEKESKKIAEDMGLNSLLSWKEIRAITGFDVEEIFESMAGEPQEKSGEQADS